MVVCNINQIRKSLFRGLWISNYSDIELLYHQFYSGIERDLTERELDIISSLATSEVRHFIIPSHLEMGRFLDQSFCPHSFTKLQRIKLNFRIKTIQLSLLYLNKWCFAKNLVLNSRREGKTSILFCTCLFFNTSQAYKNRSHIHIFQVFQCLDKGLHNLQHKLDELTGDYVVNGETAANYKYCCVTA